jgi:uncharacterized protein
VAAEPRQEPTYQTGIPVQTIQATSLVQLQKQPAKGVPVKSKPLTDAEFDTLGEMLNRLGGKRSMNLEQVDGFFAALTCGPANVPPSEYLPEIWGSDVINDDVFSNQARLDDFLSLLTRHWNGIFHTLNSGDVFMPVLLEDGQGVAHANDWAEGFMRGMELRREDWRALIQDERHNGLLVPIFALAHEHDPDPEMRPYDKPIDAEAREKLVVGVAASVMMIYKFFEPQRLSATHFDRAATTARRIMSKVGRNDPCPCGSGKKFKHCCAEAALH